MRLPKLRYSLRALLIALTLLCLWLGVITYRAHRQAQIVELVRSLGGRVEYDYQYDPDVRILIDHAALGGVGPPPVPPGPVWLRDLVGDNYFCDVVRVTFVDKPEVTRDVVAQIGRLKKLRYVGFPLCADVTDEVVLQLPPSLPLYDLNLIGTRCSDESVRHASRMETLEGLQLDGTQIADDGLRYLASLPNLEQLSLNRTGVTDACLEHLQKLPKLRHLSIQNTGLSDDAVERLQEALPHLQIKQ